jgi:hypothetical protein
VTKKQRRSEERVWWEIWFFVGWKFLAELEYFPGRNHEGGSGGVKVFPPQVLAFILTEGCYKHIMIAQSVFKWESSKIKKGALFIHTLDTEWDPNCTQDSGQGVRGAGLWGSGVSICMTKLD